MDIHFSLIISLHRVVGFWLLKSCLMALANTSVFPFSPFCRYCCAANTTVSVPFFFALLQIIFVIPKIVVFLHLQTGKNPLAEKSVFFRYSADGETSTTSQKTSRNNGDCSLVLYSYYTTYDKWSVPKILICLFNKGSRSPTVRDRDKWMAPLFSHKLIFVKPPASLKHRSCARHVSG